MRAFIRRLFCLPKRPQRSFTSSAIMSSSSTAGILYAATVSPALVEGETPKEAREKHHHLKHGFTNPWDSWKEMSGPNILGHLLLRKLKGQMKSPDTTPPTVPVRKPEFLPTRDTPTLRATWLGHACYLVEFPSGLRILFDPVFSQRCSPFQWLGPKRYTETPCQINDIPIVDAVIISHSHYDHMVTTLPFQNHLSLLSPLVLQNGMGDQNAEIACLALLLFHVGYHSPQRALSNSEIKIGPAHDLGDQSQAPQRLLLRPFRQ